jgi:hypothetical protein
MGTARTIDLNGYAYLSDTQWGRISPLIPAQGLRI